MATDPDTKRAQTRERVRRHRANKGEGLAGLADHVQNAANLPDPPSREVLLKALGVQALEGNVPAIRLLLEEYRRDGDSDEKPQQQSIVDQLATRRAQRAA